MTPQEDPLTRPPPSATLSPRAREKINALCLLVTCHSPLVTALLNQRRLHRPIAVGVIPDQARCRHLVALFEVN